MKKILLIGSGKMGSIHRRVLNNSSLGSIEVVVDNKFKEDYKIADGVHLFKNFSDFKKSNIIIDGAIIASPTNSHFKISKDLLKLKIPVLIEKPISLNFKQTTELLDYSIKQQTILRCGLIEIYNPMFEFIKKNTLTDIISIHIFRQSPKLIDSKIPGDVVSDLTLHDISVLFSVFDMRKVNLIGSNAIKVDNLIETVDCLFKFNNISVFVSSSRQSQVKTRLWRIQTSDKLYLLDLIKKEIQIYELGTSEFINNNLVDQKNRTSIISFSNYEETASIQIKEFLMNLERKKIDLDHLKIIRNSHDLVSKIIKLN